MIAVEVTEKVALAPFVAKSEAIQYERRSGHSLCFGDPVRHRRAAAGMSIHRQCFLGCDARSGGGAVAGRDARCILAKRDHGLLDVVGGS